jgi:hypothetical protein
MTEFLFSAPKFRKKNIDSINNLKKRTICNIKYANSRKTILAETFMAPD